MNEEHQVQHHEAPLSEDMLLGEPMDQFADWYATARASTIVEPDAMVLATVDGSGDPDARVVLLKGVEPEGISFYTNYDSEKGRQLERHPRACLVVWWEPLARQVRLRGAVERLPAEASDRYFASRPRGSQLGAWASPQSQVIGDRAELDARVEAAASRFGEGEVQRPGYWGGYRLNPERIEFWQGRSDRLHDRFLYVRDADQGWTRSRLGP